MRSAKIERRTKETELSVSINLDMPGPQSISLGLPFFEHMLHAMAFHGGFALEITGSGDLELDPHHLVEDTGIVLGLALAQALGDTAVLRYGHAIIPMDEALSEVTIDLCKRAFLVAKTQFPQERCGQFDICLLKEFFVAFANKAEMNLHLECRYGENSHHMAESLFKALGKALFQASRLRDKDLGVASTKGKL